MTMWEPKQSEAKHADEWDQCHRSMKDEFKALQDNNQQDLEPSETTHRPGRHTGQMGLQKEIETR